MPRSFPAGCLTLVVLFGAETAHPQAADVAKGPVTYEKKDSSGRLLSRIVFNPDGTIRHSAIAYGLRAARIEVEVDLDKVRDPLVSKRETYDEEGRIVEREDMKVLDGQRTTTLTTFTYDAAGNQTTKVERKEP